MKLQNYKDRWNEKPVLQKVYEDLYRRIECHCIDGNILEIGGGIGNFDLEQREIIRTDLQFSHGVHVIADAHSLPFCDSTFNNIVLIDVLHHLECPLEFLSDAHRVLKEGGRIVMIEPGITPLSWIFYKLLHPEPVYMDWKPEEECHHDFLKDPYDSNQAIPTILFKRDADLFLHAVRGLRIVRSEWLSLFVYPLSGGFKPWSLIPEKWVCRVLKIEEKLLPFLGRLMAFRLMVVLEKEGSI